jgi:hypothetical protein
MRILTKDKPFNAEPEGELYKPYVGRIREMMPHLVGDGRKMLSTAEIMKRIVNVLGSDKFSDEVKDAWTSTNFATSDGVCYGQGKTVYLFRDARFQLDLNANTKLSHGAAMNPMETFERDEYGALFELRHPETVNDVKDSTQSESWQYLARDNTLLEEFKDAVSRYTQEGNHPDKDEIMKILIGLPNIEVSHLMVGDSKIPATYLCGLVVLNSVKGGAKLSATPSLRCKAFANPIDLERGSQAIIGKYLGLEQKVQRKD